MEGEDELEEEWQREEEESVQVQRVQEAEDLEEEQQSHLKSWLS